MYIGGRAYLEISPSARFYAWEKAVKNKDKHGDKSNPSVQENGGRNGVNDLNQPQPSNSDHLHVTVTVTDSGEWTRRDLTSLICDGTG